MKKSCAKIVINAGHDVEKINSILMDKKPSLIILESSSRINNLKTQWLAQNLINDGWRERGAKISYKGNLFKVILSQKLSKNDCPEKAQDAEGLYYRSRGSKLTANSRDETNL